jgi:hypothetical protein
MVWFLHTSFILIVAQHCSWYYFMMCPHGDCASTSTFSWALVRKNPSWMSCHLRACWRDVFSPFFQFSRKCLFMRFLFVWCHWSLCLQPLSYKPINSQRSTDHLHTVVVLLYLSHNLSTTLNAVLCSECGMFPNRPTYFKVLDIAVFWLTKFKHIFYVYEAFLWYKHERIYALKMGVLPCR